jgi:predicted GNAT family acetyltransferase
MNFIKKCLKVLKKSVRNKKIYVVDASNILENKFVNSDGIIFEYGKIDDLYLLHEHGLDYSISEIEMSKKWIKELSNIMIGWRDNKPVCYAWVSKKEIALGCDINIKLPNKDYYIYKSYVSPKERNKGLMSLMYKEIAYSINESARIYCWIANANLASINAHEKIGFVSVFSFTIIDFHIFQQPLIYKTKIKKIILSK